MPQAQGEVINGKKEGHWVTYYANGNKRSEGDYLAGQREGEWVYYHQNSHKESEGTLHGGLYEGLYTAYHKNGKRRMQGEYGPHRGKSTDGKKEGEWRLYAEDGKTVWRTVTYKRGARTKPDDFPLGLCSQCNEPIRNADTDRCPDCRG